MSASALLAQYSCIPMLGLVELRVFLQKSVVTSAVARPLRMQGEVLVSLNPSGVPAAAFKKPGLTEMLFTSLARLGMPSGQLL